MTSPRGLSTKLRQIRTAAELTSRALAGRLGWGEYKISKIENGRQMPTHAEIEEWAHHCNADDSIEELTLLLEQAMAQHHAWANRANTPAVQYEYTNLAKQTTETFAFEPNMIPGHLQVVSYARRICEELMTEAGETTRMEIEDAISQRLERATLVYDPSKKFRFLIGEAALRYWYCPPSVMRAQYAHLNMVADLPNVDIGIIPFGVQLSSVLQNSFTIFDGLVAVEAKATESRYHPDSGEAALYARVAKELWSQAVTRGDAKAMIQDIADQLPPHDELPDGLEAP